MNYYHNVWQKRCEELHDEKFQRQRLTDWYNQVITRIKNSEHYHLRKYADVRKLNIERSKNETIREWILDTLKMERNVRTYPHQDIRNWCG